MDPHQQRSATLSDLVEEIKAAVTVEKSLGFELGPNKQDAASCARLCTRVVDALQAYALSNGADWRSYAAFCDAHYTRNLVFNNDDFELIVLCWQPGQVSRVHNHSSSHCFLAPLHNAVREERYEIATEMTSPRAAASRADVPASHAPPAMRPPPPGIIPGSEAPCPPLTHIGGGDLQVGEVGYINDCMALHSIANTTCPMGAATHGGAVAPPPMPGAQATNTNANAAAASTAAAIANGLLVSPLDTPSAIASGGLGGGGAVTLHVYCPPIRRVRLYEEAEGRVVARVPGFFNLKASS